MKSIDDNTLLTVIAEDGDYEVSVPHYIFTDALFDADCTEEPTLGSLTLDVMEYLQGIFSDNESIYLDDKSAKKIESIFDYSRHVV